MKDEKYRQAVADGMILTCGCLLNNGTVTIGSVKFVLNEANITKKEWDQCDDETSKQIILAASGGNLDFLIEEDY